MKKGHVLALVILLLFGAVKLNFEERLAAEHRAAFFHGAKLNLTMRQQLWQTGFLAALSGFRSVVADFLWIQAHEAWQKTEWGRMALLFQNVTALQPRNVMFWDIAAWHMGYNASLAAFEDKSEPREARRINAQRQYFKAAEDFLLRGIQNNPDSYQLYEKLAMLYRDKFKDDQKAFEYFDKAAQFPRAPIYEKRFAAYHLSYIPGREQEAYDRLAKFYNLGENERVPTLLLRLKYLEDKLNIPPAQRVYNPDKK
jgi:hypothetical protein